MESGANRHHPDPSQFLLDHTDGERLLLRPFYFVFTFL